MYWYAWKKLYAILSIYPNLSYDPFIWPVFVGFSKICSRLVFFLLQWKTWPFIVVSKKKELTELNICCSCSQFCLFIFRVQGKKVHSFHTFPLEFTIIQNVLATWGTYILAIMQLRFVWAGKSGKKGNVGISSCYFITCT